MSKVCRKGYHRCHNCGEWSPVDMWAESDYGLKCPHCGCPESWVVSK